MKIEISKEIERLAKIYRGEKLSDAVIVGIAFGLLTDEQGKEFIETLNRWIERKN